MDEGKLGKSNIKRVTFMFVSNYTLFHRMFSKSENNMGMYCHFIHFLFNNFII